MEQQKKNVVIVGAGQMGQMALQMIREELIHVSAFADNAAALWGSEIAGIPILSVEQAIAARPDAMLIAVAGEERTEALTAQIRAGGYGGEVKALCEYAKEIDIRAAVFSRLRERIARIDGDLAELGVYQGEFACKLHAAFPERMLYLFDTFEGFDGRDVSAETAAGYSRAERGEFSDTAAELVLAKMQAPERVVLCKGYFPETTAGVEARFALVSLDADLYEPTLAGLRWFYPRLQRGGVIILHDYQNRRFSGVHAAVETYEKENGALLLLPVGDLHGSAMVIKP